MEAIRAPRGTGRSCQGWVQEAALRMLMNNLDPDVAERPEDLVVYGGTGKAARDWDSYHRIVASAARARRRRDAARAEREAGGRPRHAPRRAPRAHRQLEPRRRASRPGSTSGTSRRRGLIMYGQMTAGSWIYIGTQGILQGTYETFAQAGRTHFGDRRPRGAARPLRRARRHGRRAAARRDDARRGVPRRRDRSGADREAARTRVPRRALGRPRRRAPPARGGARGRAAALDRARRERGRRSSPSSRGAGSSPTSSPTRPPRTIR